MKVQASELRIGNLVHWCGCVHPISKIDENIFSVKLNAVSTVSSYQGMKNGISPITLTEEWRNKLGLGIDDSVLLAIDEKFYYLKLTPENNVLVYSQDYEEFTFIGKKKYVHEIQNLVHSLTGEELQVKE